MIDSNTSLGLTHFTSAAIVVYLMNVLKNAKWFPLLQKDWTVACRLFSVAVAFFVSIGIHYQLSSTGGGGHQLVLQIPSLATLALGFWHWLNQYAMQETVYQVTKSKNGGTNVPTNPSGNPAPKLSV